MRTSMRPRSAGSRRISKWLLPLLAEAAISTASPLKGTGALVAAVTPSDAAEGTADGATGICGCKGPAACVPGSNRPPPGDGLREGIEDAGEAVPALSG